MTVWSTVALRYVGIDARRDLICEWLPELVHAIEATEEWFFSDSIAPTASVDAGAGLSGEIEIAIAIDGHDPATTASRIQASLEPQFQAGAVIDLIALPRPRLLDPVLFAGSSPLTIYRGLLSEGTKRAIDILSEAQPSTATVADEVASFLMLAGVEERLLLAEFYASWLEGAAERQALENPSEQASTHLSAVTPILKVDRPPLRADLHQAFTEESASLPVDQCYELVGRLAHIQARRLDPTLTLSQEAALVRSLLPGFAHRAERQRD